MTRNFNAPMIFPLCSAPTAPKGLAINSGGRRGDRNTLPFSSKHLGYASITRWLAWMCVWVVLTYASQLEATARNDRDRYVVVESEELAQFPQRYWGRGIVFEDVFESVTRGTKQTGGRRFSGIRTSALGLVYVDPRLVGFVEGMTPGRSYLFAGIMMSETGSRMPFMGARTQYWIAVEEIEPLADAEQSDLASAFTSDMTDHLAFASVQQAVLTAQNQLIARARSEGIRAESLFDQNSPRQDPAMEAARIAVRDLVNQTGVTAAEYLSMLVRELLAQQYDLSPAIQSDPAHRSTVDKEDNQEDLQLTGEDEHPTSSLTGGHGVDDEPLEVQESSPAVDRKRGFLFFRPRRTPNGLN